MIIIYYRHRETGEITNAHASLDCQMEIIEAATAKYNGQEFKTAAYVAEVADDSLEAYLFRTRHLRANLDRQAIQDAIDALETAMDNVRYLEG